MTHDEWEPIAREITAHIKPLMAKWPVMCIVLVGDKTGRVAGMVKNLAEEDMLKVLEMIVEVPTNWGHVYDFAEH